MLSSVNTLLLRLMLHRSVVYRNGRNWSDEYSVSGRIQKCLEGEKGAWVFARVGAGAREEESEPGLARRGMQLYMNMKRRRD